MTPAQLKSSILQLAIQGKLVPQIPAEGTGEELYQQIQKEKQALIKSGKIKKEKPLPPIAEDEIPFEIPENWRWCRLGEIGVFVRGNGIKRNETIEEGLPCIRYGELYTTYKTQFYSAKSFTSKDIFDKCKKAHQHDILMALTGENKWDIALAVVYEGKDELAMGGDLCKFSPINVFSLFLVYLINSPYGIEFKRNRATGDIIVHISAEKLSNLPIPLPPLAEQRRIVAKIEELMPLIDRYDKAWTQLEAIQKKFPGDLKKSILQQAIQGKLVPQIPTEGTGEELYQQIQKEKQALIKSGKIKKEKPLPPIAEDEIPFEIPEGWRWCRLGEILSIKSGDGLTSNDMIKGNVPVYGGNGITGYHNKSIIHKKTIVIGRVGFYCGSVHVTEEEAWVTDNAFITTYPEQSIDRMYLVYILRHMNLGKDNNATAQPVVSGKKIYPLLFPLPPLAEQKRIVAKIEALMPLCDRLIRN